MSLHSHNNAEVLNESIRTRTQSVSPAYSWISFLVVRVRFCLCLYINISFRNCAIKHRNTVHFIYMQLFAIRRIVTYRRPIARYDTLWTNQHKHILMSYLRSSRIARGGVLACCFYVYITSFYSRSVFHCSALFSSLKMNSTPSHYTQAGVSVCNCVWVWDGKWICLD